MGIHVTLDIDPQGIEPAAWAAVFDETLALLQAWQPPLLRRAERLIDGVRVPIRSRTLGVTGDDAHWSVCGDAVSLETGESQRLYRDLSRYQRADEEESPPESSEPPDIVVHAAADEDGYMEGPARVFGEKTQGHPFHFAVLAAAMVVEERFPGRAMVGGDIDRGQAEEARRLAAPHLGRELPLPVRVDTERLIERLRVQFHGRALAAAFERAWLGDDPQEAVLRAFPGGDGAATWLEALRRHPKPTTLGAIGLLIDWLNAERDMAELLRLACLSAEGPRYSADDFVQALASTWVGLPRELRESLGAFRKPVGQPDTVWSLFGSMVLDMGASGRHLRVQLERTAISDALTEVFGERGPALALRLAERSDAIAAEVAASTSGIPRLVDEANRSREDDLWDLHARSEAELGPGQRLAVRLLAWSAQNALTTLRADPQAQAALASPTECKRAIAWTLSQGGPVLTEGALDALLAETDGTRLAWWLALACLAPRSDGPARTQRALFENAGLAEYARRVGADEAEMRDIADTIERMQNDDAEPDEP